MTMMRFLAVLNGLVNVAGGSAPAANSAYVVIMLRGMSGGKQFLMSDGVGVGYGARATADGIDAVYFVAQENYPVEFLELAYPVRLRRYGINRDSGGPGRHRGGAGIVREYEVMAEHAVLSMRIDSVLNPPWGVAGGMQGGTGRAIVNAGTPQERELAPLSDGTVLCRGDILLLQTGGGGGHGHPFDRPAERVLQDVRDGFVSVEAARRDYGVAIANNAVDEPTTQALRSPKPLVKAFHRKGYVDAIA